VGLIKRWAGALDAPERRLAVLDGAITVLFPTARRVPLAQRSSKSKKVARPKRRAKVSPKAKKPKAKKKPVPSRPRANIVDPFPRDPFEVP